MKAVDNLSTSHDVKNFLIGPVFGTNKTTPNGIIQFINKKGGDEIGASDIQKFNEMADLIGMSIDNTN